MEVIQTKRAELLNGFVYRKSSKELIIKLRAGNKRSVGMEKKLMRFKLGQKVFVGWDYERNCIANIWSEDEILHPANAPDEERSIPDEINFNRWVNVPI